MGRFSFAALAGGIVLVLFVAMLIMLEAGRRLGVRHLEQLGSDAPPEAGRADAAVYGLFALLLGFSFSHATTRFDHRHDLIAKEVNAIGTAWDRIDPLPAAMQATVRDRFRGYMDALLASYANTGRSITQGLLESPAVTRAHRDVWTDAVKATLAPGGEPARMLLLPAMSEMFGAAEDERLARRIHPPGVIFAMLGVAALAVSLFAGYGLASKSARSRVYMISAAASIAIAIYVIIELEYPHLGLVRATEMDHALTELRATMQ